MKRAKTFFKKEKLMEILHPDKEKVMEILHPTKKKIIIVSIVLVIAILAMILFGGRSNPAMKTVQADDIVTRGDITVTITGSSSVEPLERFEIIPKVSGDIVYCPYEIGDTVAEDDILYMFDTSDTDLTVERQRISMQQSQNSYNDALKEREKLYITAKNDGIISGLTIKEGQEVNSGMKVATVEDTENMSVEIPFTGAQIDSIFVGDTATITSSKHMSTVTGTVTHKASSAYPGGDGTALYTVEIEFKNPGAFYAGMEVGGSVNGHISPGMGTVTTMASGTVSTETDGTVVSINYKNGDYVTKGTVIATIDSDTITDRINDSTLSYMSANISMRQTEKSLEDYNIKSPINGTVITKNAKAGDTIDKTNSASTLMVVADISKLKFELAIDELDVSKVHEGQEVAITCDALPDEEFLGVITNVAVEGTASNGVTTYSAEVEIAEPGNLRPSMNIDAEIIIESAENVLMVPTEDIKTVGGRSFVFVKDDGSSKNEERQEKKELPVLTGEEPLDEMPDREMPEGANSGTERPKGEMPQMDSGKSQNRTGGKTGNMQDMTPQAPDGYIAKEIEIGISNEDYTEVKSGLSEGDLVYKTTTASSSGNNMMMGMPGGMSGGAMGGGMPGGAMGGGMPGGMSGGMPGGMR